MERLSGEDAVFLSMERPTWHQHVGGLLIFDGSGVPGFTFDRFSALVAERLPLAPRFACRIREVPLGLDRPLWVKDPSLDVDQSPAPPRPSVPRGHARAGRAGG